MCIVLMIVVETMKMEERVELATYVGKNHVILACDIGSSQHLVGHAQ
jgi:hypothetical protein